jgi:hypothetical protein
MSTQEATSVDFELFLCGSLVGARYNFLAMSWARSQGLDMFDLPPDPVRLRLLEKAFAENLAKTTDERIREHLEALQIEARAPGSTWPRSGVAGS